MSFILFKETVKIHSIVIFLNWSALQAFYWCIYIYMGTWAATGREIDYLCFECRDLSNFNSFQVLSVPSSPRAVSTHITILSKGVGWISPNFHVCAECWFSYWIPPHPTCCILNKVRTNRSPIVDRPEPVLPRNSYILVTVVAVCLVSHLGHFVGSCAVDCQVDWSLQAEENLHQNGWSEYICWCYRC